MGNSDVPVGQYTQKIFAYYGLDEAAQAFLDYLQTDKAMAVFESVGFSPTF